MDSAVPGVPSKPQAPSRLRRRPVPSPPKPGPPFLVISFELKGTLLTFSIKQEDTSSSPKLWKTQATNSPQTKRDPPNFSPKSEGHWAYLVPN